MMGPAGWSVTVQDVASRQLIVDVDLTDEQMGLLLGGKCIEVEAGYYPANHIGRRQEIARLHAPIDRWDFADRRLVEDLCRGAMDAAGLTAADGWEPDVPAKFNLHCLDDGRGYGFNVRRYVDDE